MSKFHLNKSNILVKEMTAAFLGHYSWVRKEEKELLENCCRKNFLFYFSQLPQKYQDICTLRFQDSKSIKEIAGIYACSVSNIRQYIFYSIKGLRKIILTSFHPANQ